MATVAREQAIPTWDTRGSRLGEIAVGTLRYLRRNPELTIGLCPIFALLAFVAIGHFVVDLDKARPLSTRPLAPPSPSLPLGSDKQGRNLLAVMIVGTPQTMVARAWSFGRG